MIKKIENNVPWDTLLVILRVKQLLERFTKKSCNKQIKKSDELKKLSREKVINYMFIWKSYNNSFNNWIYKTDIIL